MDTHMDLGWEPLDLTDEGLQIPDLLKECSWVDHSVAAVTHMQGGSQVRPAHSCGMRTIDAIPSCEGSHQQTKGAVLNGAGALQGGRPAKR